MIGYGGGKRFDLDGVMIEPGATAQDGWGVVTLTAMDGEFQGPGRLLVTATGYAENAGMKWKTAAKDSVGRNWGKAPSLVEGIPACIMLSVPAAEVRAWALDERGQRRTTLPVKAAGGRGVKHHVLVDAHGIPLAADVTAANVPAVNELLTLVESSGPVGGKPGRPKQRPEELYGDRAYDSEPHREELRVRGIEPNLAKRRTAHGSGLGVFRWVAERTLSWLHGFRKLRLVTEKNLDMQYAFLTLAVSVICYRYLSGSFC